MEASDYDYYITGNDYKDPSNAKRNMETNKTAKITRTTFVSEWKSPQGTQVYYHTIELDNGDSGQIGSKEKMPAKLNPGSELTYTIESTSRGNKIKAVVPAGNQFQGKGRAMPEPRIQMISFAAAYTKDLIVAGKIGISDFEKEFNKIYNVMISKI
jgi:hypothetical protein